MDDWKIEDLRKLQADITRSIVFDVLRFDDEFKGKTAAEMMSFESRAIQRFHEDNLFNARIKAMTVHIMRAIEANSAQTKENILCDEMQINPHKSFFHQRR